MPLALDRVDRENKMNKRNLLKAGLVAAMLSTAALMPATAVADTIKLKVGNWLPPVHHMTSSLRA